MCNLAEREKKNIFSATYSDVVSLRDPQVVASRGVAGGARSHVCAGETCACVCVPPWKAEEALMSPGEPLLILYRAISITKA